MKMNPLKKQLGRLLVLMALVPALMNPGIASGQEESNPDHQDARASAQFMALPAEGTSSVLPEIAQPVELSSSDVNRIICQGEIKDIIYSKEKGITVKFSGKDAFIKFRTGQKDGKTAYSITPSEIFIVCGENVYNLIAIPKRIPARSVRLSPGKTENIRKNRSLLGALPFEKRVLTVIKNLFTDEIPESFTVTTPNRKIDLFRDLDLVLARVAVIEGEGFQVKEYRGVLAQGATDRIEFSEKDFLRGEISANPIAVSLDRLVLKKGEVLRAFVVETHQEEPGSVEIRK